jgi:hypothetical protein
MDISLITAESNNSDLLKVSAIWRSTIVVANRTMDIITQKESDFPNPHRFNNIKSNTTKNNQNSGLDNEK